MAAKRTNSGINFGIIDILMIGAAIFAAFYFVPAYADWTSYRDDLLPGEECLRRELDTSCARRAFDDAYGPAGALNVEGNIQRWIWALRLLDTNEDYKRQLERIFEQGSSPLTRGLPQRKLLQLAQVSNILYHMGREGAAIDYRDTLIAMQEDAGGRVPEDVERYVPHALGGPPSCRRERDHEFMRKLDNYAELDIGEYDQNPCYLEYFRRRTDIELRPVIERSLTTMREMRKAHGEMKEYGYDGDPVTTAEYADKLAFLASLIAYRENNGWGRVFD